MLQPTAPEPNSAELAYKSILLFTRTVVAMSASNRS